MYIRDFNKFKKVNELYIHKKSDELDRKNIILYKKDLWVFDENEWEDGVADEIYKKLNIEPSDDLFDFLNEVSEVRPDVLVAEIINGYIVINSRYNYRQSKNSTDIKKLKKALNMEIKINFSSGPYLEKEEEYDIDFEEMEDSYFYHGTSINFLESISKKGIMPNPKRTNYPNIKHKDKIFLTSNIEKAYYHSVTSSINNNSLPVIIKFKIPDISKLVPDYDLSIEFFGVNNEINKKLGYSEIKNQIGMGSFDYTNTKVDSSRKSSFIKKMGIYGYIGRIPSSKIESILVDSYLINNYIPYINGDENGIGGDEISYDSELWNEINDINMWSEWSMKYAVDRIEDIESDYYDYMDEDEDEDDY